MAMWSLPDTLRQRVFVPACICEKSHCRGVVRMVDAPGSASQGTTVAVTAQVVRSTA